MKYLVTVCSWWSIMFSIGVIVNGLAIAPSTLGGAVASAGKFSNTIKDTRAWKTLTSHPNSIVQNFPARAMEVVQEVVRSLRKDVRKLITTPMGKLRGRVQNYKSGQKGTYYSFRGIRYGLPPIGNRRFRAALPTKSWDGIKDALREGSNCPHMNMLLETFKGSEDCLFLNVFTPKLPTVANTVGGTTSTNNRNKLPVMVWFHGGGYTFGSGNSFLYGPDFLVAENIVLVTLNYRLGPLGFLSAGPDAPGNSGIKDQILALKWVRDNIESFGGDPLQITIFGESAGGSSVQYLILSKSANGLFHRAISESGSALNPWAIAKNPIARSFRLGNLVGFNGSNQTDDLIKYLRQVPAKALIEAAPLTLDAEDFRQNIGLPFVPTIEGSWNRNKSINNYYLEEPILTEHPIQLYKMGKFNKIPYITGYNSHEAMLFLRRLRKNPNLLDIINEDFIRLVPNDLNFNQYSYTPKNVSNQMRKFYLGSRQVAEDTIEEMIHLFTDIMFARGISKTARLHADYGSNPVYLYRFSFDGSLGLYKRMLGISRPGVCHGDELGYLFHFGFFNLSLDPMAPEILVKRRMVKMWTNFAKYGNPTPVELNDGILPVRWSPVNSRNNTKGLNYLDIGAHLETKINPDSKRLQFWDNMYKTMNGEI